MNTISLEISDFYSNMLKYLSNLNNPDISYNCIKILDEGNEWYKKQNRTSPYIGCIMEYSNYEGYQMWMDNVEEEETDLISFLPNASTKGYPSLYYLVKKLRDMAFITNEKVAASASLTSGAGVWDARASVPGVKANGLYLIVTDPSANDQPLTIYKDTSTAGAVLNDRVHISLSTDAVGTITTTVQDLIDGIASSNCSGYINVIEVIAGIIAPEVETPLVGGTLINNVVKWKSIIVKEDSNENPNFVFLGADESDVFGI